MSSNMQTHIINPQMILKTAQSLLNKPNELKRFLKEYLPSSYNLKLHLIYLQSIKSTLNPNNDKFLNHEPKDNYIFTNEITNYDFNDELTDIENTDIEMINIEISAYEYVLNKLYMDYEIFPIVNQYYQLLTKTIKNTDEQEFIFKVRSIFHKCLKSPMNNLNSLYLLYEEFENNNGMGGKNILNEFYNIYLNTNKLQKMYKLKGIDKIFNNDLKINFDNVEKISSNNLFNELIDLELKNITSLDENEFMQRMEFIFEYLLDKFFSNEEIYIRYVQFLVTHKLDPLPVLKRGILINNSSMLIVLYAFYANDEKILMHEIDKCCREIDEFNDVNKNEKRVETTNTNQDIEIIRNENLIFKRKSKLPLRQKLDNLSIALLNLKLKSDLSSFREAFKILSEKPISENVYIYAAKAEFYATGKAENSFKIFSYAIKKFENENKSKKIAEDLKEDEKEHLKDEQNRYNSHKDNCSLNFLKKEFLKFFLSIGYDINAKNIYNQLYHKSMDEIMGIFEFKYGSFDTFSDIFKFSDNPYKLIEKCLRVENVHEQFEVFMRKLPELGSNFDYLKTTVRDIIEIFKNKL
ncbi:mRNA 3'-end-processing protein RNA14 [Dictyocoela muelleri]|nr:mRNA 3'-end-processing protein RNA14 [Dictyocoela muelleri]